MSQKIDHIDRALLRALQKDARLSQRDLADQVGLSQNACWRRLKSLNENGLVKSHTIRLDPAELGLTLTVFVMIRTRHHSRDWLDTFRTEVSSIPNVIDFYRIAGDYDYMLKVMAEDMNAFDRIYQRLITKVDLDTVTSYMTMEAIADSRDVPI
ncbi:transcriptional regulator, AsnC family [Roseibium hamelinense]|uniref:Transcriptional regulator, AsnC family n=1 Tax=Roseibium hamelinense TaxID=150831 RepID=A0A562THD0_9HYPH|nr:Lrp/AsnC family transcriptional regulator [Roseibium hamelinense]MTI43095.1 Lrp/AsnC family transcriptional regulator [Roseibium hamelinense]TWI92558.1 transcriptional regulator, AsnC family [Roseibium hamelinense]